MTASRVPCHHKKFAQRRRMMRKITYQKVVEDVRDLIIHVAYNLPSDVLDALKKTYKEEKSPESCEVLKQLVENADIACSEKLPLCQDTGLAVFFVNVGEDARVSGGLLKDAINEGTKRGYAEGYLRASTCHPFTRANLKDVIGYNLPAIIHFDIVKGNKIEIEYAAKGGGSENVSRARVFPPSAGKEGVIKFVVDCVSDAGPNPCPPIIVGVGIGGTLERAAISSKHSLFRDIGSVNKDEEMSKLEEVILEKVNELGIGTMGMGGTKTALAVHIESNPCHIASLPVSVNIQCHSSRHGRIVI